MITFCSSSPLTVPITASFISLVYEIQVSLSFVGGRGESVSSTLPPHFHTRNRTGEPKLLCVWGGGSHFL